MFLGIALVRDDHVWNWGFVVAAVILCLLIRSLGECQTPLLRLDVDLLYNKLCDLL